MSGTNDNRAAFQQMLKDSSKKQFQYVIVYKLDRFARNKVESVINKKTLQDNGVSLLSAMERITDTPEGRMMETILEGFNQYFSDELWAKVCAVHKENKRTPSRKKEIYDYILSDKLICGDCKRKMVGINGTSMTGDIHYYYSCLPRTRKHIACIKKTIQKQFIEDLVISVRQTTALIQAFKSGFSHAPFHFLRQLFREVLIEACEYGTSNRQIEKIRVKLGRF